MPKSTFSNLSAERKGQIDNTLIEVFASQHLSQVKVAEIVAKLTISRGSFYKYFIDLEDAYHYIVQKIVLSIHRDLLNCIYAEQEHFFNGIKNYLTWCSQLGHNDLDWLGIKLVTQSDDLSAFKRGTESLKTPILQEWIKLLEVNQFCIQESKEAISFLYFVMALVNNTLAELIVNHWNTEELISEFELKIRWLKNGIMLAPS